MLIYTYTQICYIFCLAYNYNIIYLAKRNGSVIWFIVKVLPVRPQLLVHDIYQIKCVRASGRALLLLAEITFQIKIILYRLLIA